VNNLSGAEERIKNDSEKIPSAVFRGASASHLHYYPRQIVNCSVYFRRRREARKGAVCTMYQWRRFQFFEKVLIKEPGTDEPKQDLKVRTNISINLS